MDKYINNIQEFFLKKNIIDLTIGKFNYVNDIEKIIIKIKKGLRYLNNCYIIDSIIIDNINKYEFRNKKISQYYNKVFIKNNNIYLIYSMTIIFGNLDKKLFIPKYILSYDSQEILEYEKNILFSNEIKTIEDYIIFRKCSINELNKQNLIKENQVKIGQLLFSENSIIHKINSQNIINRNNILISKNRNSKFNIRENKVIKDENYLTNKNTYNMDSNKDSDINFNNTAPKFYPKEKRLKLNSKNIEPLNNQEGSNSPKFVDNIKYTINFKEENNINEIKQIKKSNINESNIINFNNKNNFIKVINEKNIINKEELKDINKKEEINKNYQNLLDKKENQIKDLKKEIEKNKKLNEEYNSIKYELENSKKEIDNLSKNNTEMKKKIDEYKIIIDSKKKDEIEKNNKLKIQENQIKELEKKNIFIEKKLKDNENNLEEQIKIKENEIEEQIKKLRDEYEEKINKIINKNKKLEKENIELKNKIKKYERIQKNQEELKKNEKNSNQEDNKNQIIKVQKENNLNNINDFSREKEEKLNEKIFLKQPNILLQKQGLKGFNVIGESCYINAVLQCLSQTKSLKDYFLKESTKDFIINDISKKNNNSTLLSLSFLELIHELFENNDTKTFNPEKFLTIVEKLNPAFKKGQPGDSKDFLIFILQQIHKELKTFRIIKNVNIKGPFNQYDKINVLDYFIDDFQKQLSIISDIFFGLLQNTNECIFCKKNYKLMDNSNPICYNFSSFNYISFPLGQIKKIEENSFHSDNIVTIYDYFNYNQKDNYFTEIYCNFCKKNSDSFYTSKIYSSPNVLILILDRYKNDNNDIKFDFYEKIDITQFILEKEKPQIIYDLYAVITLIIKNNNKYFIASCKNPVDKKWYRYHEDKIFQISNVKKDIIDYETPYILFYQKI